jgi:pimeloyl-ACP methyl ester carboxylesterase
MSAFVLVHGAWHGGWCWSRVVAALWAAGHRAYAPTLTGLGERVHLANATITLDTHIADVVNLIRYEGLDDVVLCGHSYGGFVISGVAEAIETKIGALVFLDAFLPRDGESLFDVVPEVQRARQLNDLADHGGLALPPIPARHFRVNEADQAWVDAQCVPQPVGTFGQKLHLTGAVDRIAKRAYVRAGAYPSESFDLAAARAVDLDWRVYDVPAGHDVMLDAPDTLVEILLAQLD